MALCKALRVVNLLYDLHQFLETKSWQIFKYNKKYNINKYLSKTELFNRLNLIP